MPFPTDVENLVVDANETLDRLNATLDTLEIAIGQEQAAVAFVAPSSSMLKNDAPKNISVKLYTANEQPLAQAVTVDVEDGGGTAQPGVHYSLSPSSVTFPTNSPNGDTETVTVTPIPSAITSDKTAILKLNPGKLGTIAKHEVEIADEQQVYDLTQEDGDFQHGAFQAKSCGRTDFFTNLGAWTSGQGWQCQFKGSNVWQIGIVKELPRVPNSTLWYNIASSSNSICFLEVRRKDTDAVIGCNYRANTAFDQGWHAVTLTGYVATDPIDIYFGATNGVNGGASSVRLTGLRWIAP